MIVRWRQLVVLSIGALFLLGPGAATTVRAQTVVITAKSVKDLAEDFEYLVKSVAPEGDPMGGAALEHLNRFKSGDLLKGLDQNRGFGLAVSLPRDFPQGGTPSVVAAVPVSNYRQLLDSLKELGLAVDDQPGVPGFSHKVTAQDGNFTLFALESKAYAFFSLVPDGADRIREIDPSSWRPKGQSQSALSARVHIAEVPDALKDQFLDQVEAQAKQDTDRKPDEKDVEYRARMAGQNLALSSLKSMVRDGDAVALDLDINRRTSEISIELSLTARGNTAMAKTLQVLDGRRSRFEGLGQGAGLAIWFNLPMAKELRTAMADGFEEGLKQGLKAISSEPKKKLLARFVELVKSVFAAPETDYGLALRRSSPNGGSPPRFEGLFGITVPNGQEFERLVRDAIAENPPEKGVKITFDAAKAADGTAIHEMSGPYDEKDKKEAELLRIFGKASLSFAFRKDALLLSFGEGSQAALRRAIDGLATMARPNDPKCNGPLGIVVRVASLGEMASENQEVVRRVSTEVFHGAAAKRDRLSFDLTGGGNGIRLRLAIDLPAFKFAVMMGKETRK
jgi:hypothetical protein